VDCLANTGVTADLTLVLLAAFAVIVGGMLIVTPARRGLGRASGALLMIAVSSMVLGLAPASSAAAGSDECVETPYTMSGSWEGEVEFLGSFYTVRAVVTDDGTTAAAVVDYPGLCTSTWAQTGRSGDTVTFRETLTPGFDPLLCVDNGIVTLTPTGNPFGSTLAWTYVYDPPAVPDQFSTLYPVP